MAVFYRRQYLYVALHRFIEVPVDQLVESAVLKTVQCEFESRQGHRMERLKYNMKILEALVEYIVQNPQIRFGQALSNLDITTGHRVDITDEFYTESEVTWGRVEEVLRIRNLRRNHGRERKD